MEEINKQVLNENENDKQIYSKFERDEYKWFYDTFPSNQREQIFEIIYSSLFKKGETFKRDESPKRIEDYIQQKDDNYFKKTRKEIIKSFRAEETELNKRLEKYKIRLMNYDNYCINLEDDKKDYFIKIINLRKIRFGETFEWICNCNHLLYFQYCILKYQKPSRIKSLDENHEEEKVDTIDCISKANEILEDENFIYIKDSGAKNVDFNQIFKDGKKNFDFSKQHILKYLDYKDNEQKQIIDSELTYNYNYENIIEYCFESHFSNLIYSFHNGDYFFEYNLIQALNDFQRAKAHFFYININKINKIFNNKNLFKEYVGFWMAKLFSSFKNPISQNIDDKKRDNESIFVEFINKTINSIYKNKDKYLEIILNDLNEEFEEINKGYSNVMNFSNRILIILNNIEPATLKIFEKNKFRNLNILFIFNIQNNFDIFQLCYYDENKLKVFFLENNDEIIYKNPDIKMENENEKFYSIYKTLDEYENSKKAFINQILSNYKTNKEKLLNIAFILNIYQFINKINNDRNEIQKLKMELGIPNDIYILKEYCPFINFNVSVTNHLIFTIESIKFKELIFQNYLKEIYLSHMISYLNTNLNEFYLDDIKGPLLEKDIILNILSGEIKDEKYNKFCYFKKIKVQSLYCLNFINDEKNFEDNKMNNVVITQKSKTAELYDVALKINDGEKNHMKFAQISTFKDINDLSKLNKESITLDLIYFDSNKERLNLGNIDSYSFSIITSISVFKEYKNLDKDKKSSHTFYQMKEHCIKNNFEFYVYNYFNNKMYIYDETTDDIKDINNFFSNVQKIDLLNNEKDLYEFINSTKKKYSIKFIKKNLFHPIENYYQANNDNKLHIISLANYDYNPSMADMFTGIKNLGLAFLDYDADKNFNNLIINLNDRHEYFKGNKICESNPNNIDKLNNKNIHTILFKLNEEENKITEKEKNFLQKKRNNSELFKGNLSDIRDSDEDINIKGKNNNEKK